MIRGQQILVSIVLLFLLISFVNNFINHRKKVEFYESFRHEFEEEQQLNATLKTQILKSQNQNQIERIIRDQLNLAQSGEVVVIVPSPAKNPDRPTPTLPPIPNQWLSIFFGN